MNLKVVEFHPKTGAFSAQPAEFFQMHSALFTSSPLQHAVSMKSETCLRLCLTAQPF